MKDQFEDVEDLKSEIREACDEMRDSLIELTTRFGPTIQQYENALRKILNAKSLDDATLFASKALSEWWVMKVINGLDLFSGIGGLSVALSDYIVPIAYCENDRYAQAVLLSRMFSGDLPFGPIWDDVRTLRGYQFQKGEIDIIYGGFPCQDISVAGHGKGLEGKRSGLVLEIFRLVKEIKPKFIFLENVPAIRTRGGEIVCKELARLGFDCRWTIVSAQEVGAPHLRKRWFLLAALTNRVAVRVEQQRLPSRRAKRVPPERKTEFRNHGEKEFMADAQGVGSRTGTGKNCRPRREDDFMREAWWATESVMGRVVNGVPQRVDRIRGLGNAVVPLQAKTAFERLIGLSK